jgi:hypothetical protein
MTPDPFELEFRAVVAASPMELRARLVESVVGAADDQDESLEILDNGPDRYASRYRAGSIEQLRVAEWSGPDQAQGAIEHSIDGQMRLMARYAIGLNVASGRTVVTAKYTLTTPFQGLAFSFRIGRRYALARRLAASWLTLASPDAWRRIEIVHSGAVRSASRARGA